MTVINALVFNPESGAIVSDEQGTSGGRKENTAKKVFPLFDKPSLQALVGSAGPISANLKTIFDSQNKPTDATSYDAVVKNIVKNAVNGRHQQVQHYLHGKFGISFEEALTGKTQSNKDINPQITQAYMTEFTQGIQSSEHIGQYLLLGRDSHNSMAITAFDSREENVYQMFQGHFSIGSGADASNTELSKFMMDIPRDKRNKINPVKGLEILLYATKLSEIMNNGVGGIPDIGIIYEGKIIQPKEDESKLAQEIARANKRGGLIRPEFAYDALDSLLLKGSDHQSVDKALWDEGQMQGNLYELSKLLREYRIEK